jgi:hypothetical protein
MALTKVIGAGAEGLTLSSTSLTVANGLTLTDGDVTLASGHGISFAADSSASGMASELFHDYEEGTWTPAFKASSDPTVTYSVQVGVYTKIGQMVNVTLRLATNGVSSGSGALRIDGLPFNSVSTSDVIPTGAVVASSWTGEHPMKFRLINNGDDIYLYYRSSLTATDLNNSNVSDLTTASGGHNLTEITATYFTSS